MSRKERGLVDGAVLSDRVAVLRWFGPGGDDRLLVLNLRDRLHALPAAEPLLGLAPTHRWSVLASSEDTKYGGWGTPPLDNGKNGWWIPAESAVLLMPVPVPHDA
jgi:maltooligosyltrehalose trehalohydrolase